MDTRGLLAELVASPTISGEPQPQRLAIEMCLSVLRQLHNNINVDADLSGPHPWAVLSNRVPPGAHRVTFCCHVDTVPVGPLSSWSFPPFGAEIHDGRLVGRGSTDMKSGLVATLAAVDHALQTGVPVALILTSDEEVGALGAHRSRGAVEDLEIGAVVVPEATGNVVHLGHRGALWLRVATAGIAAHGSTPHLGRNAILALLDLVARARTDLPQSSDPDLGTSTWNVGLVSGGVAPNIVPAQADLVVDHRTVNNEQALLRWWTDQPEAAEVVTLIDLPAVWTSATDPWVAGLPGDLSGLPVSYFTDAAALQPALSDVPVVVWGPGDPATMHAVDEAVDLSEIDTAIAHYRRLIDQWGGQGQSTR